MPASIPTVNPSKHPPSFFLPPPSRSSTVPSPPPWPPPSSLFAVDVGVGVGVDVGVAVVVADAALPVMVLIPVGEVGDARRRVGWATSVAMDSTLLSWEVEIGQVSRKEER